ncbi:MAG: prepilin peptidase CpaA [Phycisphaerales bacterium]|nr:prepilin peptidase CpaA [Phycisphaerales bacterium]
MNTYTLLLCAPVLVLLAVAAFVDWRIRRIPNWLTFTLVLSGLAQSLMPQALVSPGNAILGCLAGFALTFMLYAVGALGAGDVKLLAGIGAWFGPQAALAVFVIEAVIGMVMALMQAAHQGRTGLLLKNSALVAVNLAHVSDVGLDHVRRTGQACRSIDRPLPYAVPVLLAVMILLLVGHG